MGPLAAHSHDAGGEQAPILIFDAVFCLATVSFGRVTRFLL